MTATIRDETVLDLLVRALPHLRGGLRAESALFTATLLYDALDLDAAAVTSTDEVLAFVGTGADHHATGGPCRMDLTQRVLADGIARTTHDRADLGCDVAACPLTSAVVAPMSVRGNVAGTLKLYRAGERAVDERDERIVTGLARVFGVYLEIAELDARAALVTRAELETLRAQIAPHFVFNTLTTIAALTRIDGARAHDLILDFAELFREMLSDRGDVISLANELDAVERYVRLERVRFGERLRFVIDVDADARRAVIPVLVVQPLVENAIRHGIAPLERNGTVTVRGYRRDTMVCVEVVDDGAGIAPDRLQADATAGLGMALDNIARRLVNRFGATSALEIVSVPGQGTRVRFVVPASPA